MYVLQYLIKERHQYDKIKLITFYDVIISDG
jgi:hypothetical protein